MSFSCVRRVAPGAIALFAAACGGGGSSPGGASPSAGAPAPVGESVTFDQADVLTAAPGDSVPIGVHVTGQDTNVSLWLDGDYADASLADGQVTTTGQRATITLHAPSVASTFAVRARVDGGPDAVLRVSVSAGGFVTLRVLPSYDGKRPAPGVTASVFVHSTCSDLAASFAKGQLSDGGLAQSGTVGEPIAIESVPAGSHVAVSVRIAHYAAGCADLDALVPGKPLDVGVDILDRPMALDRAELDSVLTFEPTADELTSWQEMLDAAIARAAAAFVSGDDATTLLNAMRADVPQADQGAFDASRTQDAWDTKARAWLSKGAPLHDRAAGWLTAAKPSLLGNLTGHIGPASPGGFATLTLKSFASLDVLKAGVDASGPFAWSADADDVVHLAGALRIWPTALVCAGADARAAGSAAGVTDVPSAIAAQIDCAGLATAILGASGTSYPSCDVTCTATLCEAGLSSLWSAAAASSSGSGDALPISVSASAQAQVGDTAEPTSFSGAWVGQVASGSSSYGPAFGMHGKATGVLSVTPP